MRQSGSGERCALLLVGGGHAHVRLLRAWGAAPPAAADITLLTPIPALLYSGMVPGLVAGHYRQAECTIALQPLADRAGISLRLAAATRLDAARQTLDWVDSDGAAGTLRYDVLSLDVGGVVDDRALPGARQYAVSVRPIEAFVGTLGSRFGGAASAPLGAVVVGGGAAGFELALALRRRLGAAAQVGLVVGRAGLLGNHAIRARQLASAALQAHGVAVHDDEAVEVDAEGLVLQSGVRLQADLTVVATGTAAPGWLRDSGLALDPQGHVSTAATLQSVSHPAVYAVGDVAASALPGMSRNGVHAVRAGAALADNLRRAVAAAAPRAHRARRRTLSLLSCSDGNAIASWGRWALAGRSLGWLKERIDRRFVG